MRSPWFFFAASLWVLATAPAQAATVLEKTVHHRIQPGGEVLEETRLRVRLESEADLEPWSPYYIYLDDNRHLDSVQAAAVHPNGKRQKVRRRGQDRLEVPTSGSLHSSEEFHVLEFPPQPAGTILEIEYRVRVEPYFQAGRIVLAEHDPISSLSVEVSGADDGWRWSLDGPQEELVSAPTAGGIRIEARDLAPAEAPELAPRDLRRGPTLVYAWGERRAWEDVARWYESLLEPVGRDADPVRRKAGQLVAGIEDKRQRLETLAAFVQQDVRYVAVEVGIGGYRPTEPLETLERQWGDCKDKSFLLIDLLRASGIEAFPALIRADQQGRVDADFPSPQSFNHLIVAVPAGQVEVSDEDPQGSGYLFVDPTQTRGRSRWLHPADQDQNALIVRGAASELVRTPVVSTAETRRLKIDLQVDPDGAAQGGVTLELSGLVAASTLSFLETASEKEAQVLLRRYLGAFLPGASLDTLAWTAGEDARPSLSLEAKLRISALVQGAPGRRSFSLTGLTATPTPDTLVGREAPAVIQPGIVQSTWRIALPAGWCPLRAGAQAVENELGTFRREERQEDGAVIVERQTRIAERWVDTPRLSALTDLSLAEHRSAKRRVRLRCE